MEENWEDDGKIGCRMSENCQGNGIDEIDLHLVCVWGAVLLLAVRFDSRKLLAIGQVKVAS